MHPRYLPTICAALVAALPLAAQNFTPDPQSVQRFGPAYRYPQAGWIVLHVEGSATTGSRCVITNRALG